MRTGVGACLAAAVGPLLLCAAVARADPTWPASSDEMEEIMYQTSEYQTRNFADTISPCTNEASGPGRQNAAEWLRVGFHDMSTADFAAGTGGLDASIMYEVETGENLGPGFNTTLQFMAAFLTSRSSMADLIALGVYASVRSCGGPAIPFRAGRVDATGPGRLGVPQPQHHIEQFREQFTRMGFSNEEMIQVTACGHTIGGVHEAEFPELLIQGEAPLDDSVAKFDNKIVTEYLTDNTTNPLVVGPAVALGKDSDARIFASDGNVTAKALSDPVNFSIICKNVLQKMIDIVPKGIYLTNPVLPYMVKPTAMQLTMMDEGYNMRLRGKIRVRTTQIPHEAMGRLTLRYKDRDGGNNCGPCSTTATYLGMTFGLDDSFVFYPIETMISAKTGISSFNITLELKNGTILEFDNNGHQYPMQDASMILVPNSCLLQHNGQMTTFAAIRNDRLNLPVNLVVSYKAPRPGLVVPGLYNTTLPMTKGVCVGYYTLYSTSWTIPGGISHSARIDVASGVGAAALVDDFNHAVELPGTCRSFRAPPASQCAALVAPLAPIFTPSRPSPTTVSSILIFSSTPVPVTLLTSTTSVSLSTSSTVTSVTSAAQATTSTTASASPAAQETASTGAATSQRPGPEAHDADFGFVAAAKDYFGYMVNYVANFFFGYDRYQIVNNKSDRTT